MQKRGSEFEIGALIAVVLSAWLLAALPVAGAEENGTGGIVHVTLDVKGMH